MSDFKTRLLEEQKQLREKIDKLSAFISSEKFSTVDAMSYTLLPIQLDAMTIYNNILVKRIELIS